jgi:uncharacterized membrane protein YphA (DoxX/SURF4 family)
MQRWWLIAGRLFLGGVLFYAGYVKVQQPWISLASQVDAYQVLPQDAVIFVAKTLPWFEIGLGAVILAGLWLRWTGLAASLLLGAFFVVLLRAYLLGMDIDCGCFGPGEKLTWKTLLRDAFIFGVACSVTLGAFLRSRTPPQPGKEPAMAEKAA